MYGYALAVNVTVLAGNRLQGSIPYKPEIYHEALT